MTEHMPPQSSALSEASALIYGIGAQKAGTTWLHQQLSRHDRVHASKKEHHYWDKRRAPYIRWDAMAFPAVKLRKGSPLTSAEEMFAAAPDDHSAYHACISDGANPGDVVLDFSPAYALCSAATFREMRDVPVRTLFVFLLRDPVSRLWSGVRQRFRLMFQAGRAQERHLVDAFERALEDEFDPDLRRSRYDITLAALDAAVPKRDQLVLSFPQLLSDAPNRVLSRVGLTDFTTPSEQPANVGIAGTMRLDRPLLERAYARLAPAYAAADAVFGGRPDGWLTDETFTQAGTRITI